MGGSLRLGKIFGISIRLHYSWFIIFFLITLMLSLSTEFFPSGYPLWGRVAGGIVTSLFLFASVITHELAHSLVAIRNGIPVRSITLFFLGGVAQITREASRPTAELVMAIVGPLCSLMLAGIFGAIWFLVWGSTEPIVVNPVLWLAYINLILALFNLIPGFPLDGGRILRALLWQRTGNYRQATRIATWSGRGVAYLMIIGGIVAIFTRYLDPFNGLWFAFIGWFLHSAATTGYRQAEMRDNLRGFTAQDVMTADYFVVSPSLSLRELVQSYLLPYGRPYFMVGEGGKLRGIVDLDNIKAVPQQRWDMIQISQVMVPLDKLVVATPEEDALSVLERMDENNVNQLPVVREGIIVGIIVRDNLLRFLRFRSELKV